MKNAILTLVLLAGVAIANTTLRFQDLPTSWVIVTKYSAASLRTSSAPIGTLALNTDDYDVYVATGTATGEWRNTRLGTGP